MTGFLKELVSRVEAVQLNKQGGPDGQVEERDHVVGVMSDGLKRLWVVRSQVAKDGLQACLHGLTTLVEAKGVELTAAKQDEFQAVGQQLESIQRRGKILDDLFWEAINFEFPELAAKPSVGVRTGWQVVWSEEAHHQDIGDILAALADGRARVIEVPIRQHCGD